MPDHTHNWGAIDEILREMGPAAAVLGEQPVPPERARAFLRWFFGALEALTHSLKRIAVEHASRDGTGIELSKREQEVLAMLKEPSFPGLPPPRRIEYPMRETLGVALNVYARARNKETPLAEGRLPTVFVEASVLHDRLAHPESPEDLRVEKADFVTIVEFLRWFETIRSWLFKDRLAELDELKTKINASTDALRRKLMGMDDSPSSA